MTANKTTHPLPASDRVGLCPINKESGASSVSHDNTWDEKVARGRALVTEINDRKWELGDLANEVCPSAGRGAHNDGLLWRFAEEIGVTPSSLNEYRRVATAWPHPTRVGSQTWTTHRLLAEREDRHEIIAEQVWTYNSLSERLGRLPNPSRGRDLPTPEAERRAPNLRADIAEASPEQKRDIFTKLAADSDVVNDAATRLHAESAIDSARAKSNFQARGARAAEVSEAEKKDRGGVRAAVADALMATAKRKLHEAAGELHEAKIDDEARDLLRERVDEVVAAAELIRRKLDGVGTADWDAELAALIGGEQ